MDRELDPTTHGGGHPRPAAVPGTNQQCLVVSCRRARRGNCAAPPTIFWNVSGALIRHASLSTLVSWAGVLLHAGNTSATADSYDQSGTICSAIGNSGGATTAPIRADGRRAAAGSSACCRYVAHGRAGLFDSHPTIERGVYSTLASPAGEWKGTFHAVGIAVENVESGNGDSTNIPFGMNRI